MASVRPGGVGVCDAKRARTVARHDKHDFDLSLYVATTYFWRWNNRKSDDYRISLFEKDLWLALE
jgi:hypothetical protein